MKLLYLCRPGPDYLSDDLLYGLRSLLGEDVVDFPKKEVLYRSNSGSADRSRIYGRGFHCFGLPDVDVDRTDLLGKLAAGYFDAVVNSSVWRIRSPRHRCLVGVDGEDHALLHRRYAGRIPVYFKRELHSSARGVHPILFALPDFLLDETVASKTKEHHASFRVHGPLRREIASRFPPDFSFATWEEYLSDIKGSWFGISPKGEGYDCQRHYEILGHAVLCLYMDRFAPLGMRRAFQDGVNCLHFSSLDELAGKIASCRRKEALIVAGRKDLTVKHLASRRAADFLSVLRGAELRPGKMRWSERLAWRLFVADASREARTRAEWLVSPVTSSSGNPSGPGIRVSGGSTG